MLASPAGCDVVSHSALATLGAQRLLIERSGGTEVGRRRRGQLLRHWIVRQALHRVVVAVLENTLGVTLPYNDRLVGAAKPANLGAWQPCAVIAQAKR